MKPLAGLLLLACACLPVSAQRPTDLAGCEELLRREPREQGSYMCFAELVRMEGHDAGPVIARLEGMIATQPGDARPRGALGRVLQFKDAARAQELFTEAVSLAREEGDEVLEGWQRWRLFCQLGVRGHRDEADAEAQRAAELAERVDDPHLTANIGLERARMITRGSELSRAWHIVRQIELDPRFGELRAPLRVEVFNLCATLAVRLGLEQEGFRYATLAEQLSEAEGLQKPLGSALLLKARASIRGGIPGFGAQQAISATRRALELQQAVANATGIFNARWMLARFTDDDEAWEHLRIIEEKSRRDPFGQHMLRKIWSEMGRRMMMESPPRTEEALELFEAALDRARQSSNAETFAATLTDLARARLQTGPRESAVASAMEAMQAIEELEDLQSQETQGAHLFAARSGIYYLMVDYLLESGPNEDLEMAFSIVERMRARSLNPEAPDESPLTLDAELRADEALLSFVVPAAETERAWLLLRTAGKLRVHELRGGHDLQNAARFWVNLIQQRDAGEPLAAARVYERLLQDVLEELPESVEHLIVLPDGILHRLPFDALRPQQDAPPLAMRYRVTVAPSVAAWLGMRQRDLAGTEPAALILADPEPPRRAELPVAWRSADYLGDVTGRLPHARSEARHAMDSLGRGELLLGDAATEEAVKSDGQRFGLIHFAAHAVIDQDRPERSAILLSPGDGEEDGLLQAGEISGLRLEHAVVILSACRSAGGPILAGEGVMGLARSFFHAGADAVVGGLWPLHDRETADLMELFYRRLARGDTLGSAMSTAKRAMIEQGRPTAAWAGLVVMGAGETVTWPAGSAVTPATKIAAGLLLGALLVGYVIYRSKRA